MEGKTALVQCKVIKNITSKSRIQDSPLATVQRFVGEALSCGVKATKMIYQVMPDIVIGMTEDLLKF